MKKGEAAYAASPHLSLIPERLQLSSCAPSVADDQHSPDLPVPIGSFCLSGYGYCAFGGAYHGTLSLSELTAGELCQNILFVVQGFMNYQPQMPCEWVLAVSVSSDNKRLSDNHWDRGR